MPRVPTSRSGRYVVAAPEPATLHVRPRLERWVVCCDDAPRALSLHERQQDALQLAEALARRSGAKIFVHHADGRAEWHDALARRAG